MTADTTSTRTRCAWANTHPLLTAYHDTEWGVPVHDDRRWFEMLTLEGAQAGLSWLMVLKRRASYAAAFAQWDVAAIAAFGDDQIAALLLDPGIIRHKAKVRATVANARAFLEVQGRYGSFDAFVWRFVDGTPQVNCPATPADVPTFTAASEALSRALASHGFAFVGRTICYALMQACGLVNDHTTDCFCADCPA